MEIAPIAGIRVMPVNRVRPADPELSALFAIEAAAHPSDDTYTASSRKAAGAAEPEEEELEEFAETDDEDPDPDEPEYVEPLTEFRQITREPASAAPISFFA